MVQEYKIKDYKAATWGRQSAHYHEFFILTRHPFRPEALMVALNTGAPSWARASVSHPSDEIRRGENIFVVGSHAPEGQKLAERVLEIVGNLEKAVDEAQAHEQALDLLEVRDV